MFTGLIEKIGSVAAVDTTKTGKQMKIIAPGFAKKIRDGDSLAVNGCCLTVTSIRGHQLAFNLLNETMARTNLKELQRKDAVNLERAVAAGERFGGHLVQGHIDCVARVISYEKTGADFRLEIELPKAFSRYVVCKGSIAVNGISLTVAEVHPNSFIVWIIPHTKMHTNLDRAEPGDPMNIEFDILAKYVERMLASHH